MQIDVLTRRRPTREELKANGHSIPPGVPLPWEVREAMRTSENKMDPNPTDSPPLPPGGPEVKTSIGGAHVDASALASTHTIPTDAHLQPNATEGAGTPVVTPPPDVPPPAAPAPASAPPVADPTPSAPPAQRIAAGALPVTFPHADLLMANGVETYEAVRVRAAVPDGTKGDLTELAGIGAVRATEIREALADADKAAA